MQIRNGSAPVACLPRGWALTTAVIVLSASVSIAAVAQTSNLTQQQLYRLMRASFDSALDARYGRSQGQVWAVFIHPSPGSTDDGLISAIGQTVAPAGTYGTSFSFGALSYGGGDHGSEIFESLRGRGTLR